MKFPILLSLDLLRSKVFRAFVSGRDSATIFHLSPAVFSSSNQKEIDAESDPNAAVMEIPASIISQTAAPVLWLGGEEPLQHPVIGRISAALNQAGRNVFLHTGGVRLRQRIHEFRPGELFEYLDNYGVDGFIVSSGGSASESSLGAEFQEKLVEIRSLVRCSRWEYFSSLLEASYVVPREKKAAMPLPGSDTSAYEESA